MKHIFYTMLAAVLLMAMSVMAEPMPTGYYVSIEGKQDAALKDALRGVIRPHTVIPYGSGTNSTWEMFYYSDSKPLSLSPQNNRVGDGIGSGAMVVLRPMCLVAVC